VVATAAWLHDVGYGPRVRETGFHPMDGARYLRARGWSPDVVSLVAHHTGALYEAAERGLADELGEFPAPDEATLDALCLADLTTGPDGNRVTVDDRISEILGRYASADPVHRAITRSQVYLRGAAARAATASGSTDEWVRAALV
jgi:predicted HD phosphohydrolase